MSLKIETLQSVVAGDQIAWHAVLLESLPVIERRVRRNADMRRCFRGLDQPDCDYMLDIRELVFRRLAQYDHRSIRVYLETARSRPTTSFVAWLNHSTDFVINEYLRQKYGPARESGLHKRDVGSCAGEFHEDDTAFARQLSISGEMAARSLMETARRMFSADELACFERYLAGDSYGEIADAERLENADAAQATVRRLKQRLREALEKGHVSKHWLYSGAGSNP